MAEAALIVVSIGGFLIGWLLGTVLGGLMMLLFEDQIVSIIDKVLRCFYRD